jgi:hypothetical protein
MSLNALPSPSIGGLGIGSYVPVIAHISISPIEDPTRSADVPSTSIGLLFLAVLEEINQSGVRTMGRESCTELVRQQCYRKGLCDAQIELI